MNYVYQTIHKGNTEGWMQGIRDTYEDVTKRFYATVIPFDYIALTILDDAIDTIEERGLMRHNVKKLVRNIERQRTIFGQLLRSSMSNRKDGLGMNRYYLVLNMSNELYKIIEHDIFLLGMSIKSVMDKAGIDDTRFKTGIVMANTMLNFSCQLFDEFFKAYKQRTMADFSRNFTAGRLTGILSDFITISKQLCPDIAGVDFDSDRNCQTAFTVLNRKIADGDALNTAGERAMREDAVFRRLIEDNERETTEETLRQRYKTRLDRIKDR